MHKINTLPTNWPSDGRSRRVVTSEGIFLTHPDREPVRYCTVEKKWKEAK